MRHEILSAATLCAALVVGQSAQANPLTYGFSFWGAGVSGHLAIEVAPNTQGAYNDPGFAPYNNVSGNGGGLRNDPTPAYAITSITGTFSDSTLGIVNASITGLVGINPANERDVAFDKYVPASLSFIDFAGANTPGAQGPYLSYDNLFFPDGNPFVCDPLGYPFKGTLLDVFGVAFTVEGGYTVDFWGDGNLGFGPLTYGVGVVGGGEGGRLLDYTFAGISVPEPGSMSLFGAGVGLLVLRRKFAKAGSVEIPAQA